MQCLVYFRVEADKKLFGQNCIPVISLQSGKIQLPVSVTKLAMKLAVLLLNFPVINVGIKFIPLRTPGGELIPGSGLFVQIKKTVAFTGSTEPEASNREAVEVSSKPQVRRISRQEAIDNEHGTIRNASKKQNEDDDKVESSGVGGKFDNEDPTASYKRRFTSPASLESNPGDPFKEYDSSKLTVVAEVHENIVL